MSFHFTRAALLGGLCLFSASALADGSGTLNDTTLTLSYSGGPLVAPNPLVLADSSAPPPTCMDGVPTCDVYMLTVDLSDAFRANPANDKLRISFTLSFDGDWDMWMQDGDGADFAAAAGTDNPEVITLGLKALPNGVYKFQMTPFFPETTGFELTVDASGSKHATTADKAGSNGLLLGAFAPLMLLGMLLMAVFRAARLNRFWG